MIGWETLLYAFVGGAMLMLSVVGLASAVTIPDIDRVDRRFFTVFFAALVVGSAAFFLELAAFTNPTMTAVRSVAYFLQSTSLIIPFPLLALYLLHCCGEDRRSSLLSRGVWALWGAYLILVIVGQFTDLMYYSTPENTLAFGPAYSLSIALVLLMVIFIAVGTVRRRNKLSPQYYSAFLVCLVPMALSLIVHAFTPAFTLLEVGVTISAVSMYYIIVSDTVERNRQQQRKIENQRASISVLRMRPHFIYNTMTTIYYLCDQDPQLAKRVTRDFTTYLRKIFNAVTSEDTIPFSEELEHTRAYLAVEQAQFEDGLVVEYDTPHTRFRVPPLTLQPLVENAVKHGMDMDSGPLHIVIRTRETEAGSEVVVEDDGPGFDPAIADDPRTTLANIRQRLALMCGGTLDIEAREGGGSVVKATIPQQS